MSASASHRQRAIARAQGRHIASFTEAVDSALRVPTAKPRHERARVAERLADARVVDALVEQWHEQFELPARPARTRVSIVQSKATASWQPPMWPMKSGPHLDDCYNSVARRATQAEKDRAERAKPVRMPDGAVLNLRAYTESRR